MWITQLVVHRDHRGKGHASTLLRLLIALHNPLVVGVASSHPHGILALKKASMSLFDEEFIKIHVERLTKICNIKYLLNKPLVGTLFQPTDSGLQEEQPRVQINTAFYTDHTEPLDALTKLPRDVEWPLGPLLEGHEFVVVFHVRSNRMRNTDSVGSI
jgi:hypothetical protein